MLGKGADVVTLQKVLDDAKHFEVVLIADGVYAAIAKPGTGAIANGGFVDLGDTVLVFDTFNTQQAAEELREAITSLTGKPVSHVINSHWHGDHIRGNQVFREVSIVATEQTKSIMQQVHPARIARQRAGIGELREYIQQLDEQQGLTEEGLAALQLGQQVSLLKDIEESLPTLELVLPNETFEAQWSYEGTAQAVECHSLGGGHTACDAFLYLPDVKVCYIGDLVAVENHMLVVDGDVENWISILNELKGWDIECIIPGHGQVAGKEWIFRAADYLRGLLDRSLQLRGKDFSGAAANLEIPPEFRNWAAPEIYQKNLEHLLRPARME